MTSALRAPELSAILRIDSCWITLSPLPRPLEDLDHPPPLSLRQGPRLGAAHGITGLGALVVVRRDLLGPDHLLAVEPVRKATHQRDRDGLRHLVAHNDARAHLTPPPHARFLSRRRVCIRTMCRRRLRNGDG